PRSAVPARTEPRFYYSVVSWRTIGKPARAAGDRLPTRGTIDPEGPGRRRTDPGSRCRGTGGTLDRACRSVGHAAAASGWPDGRRARRCREPGPGRSPGTWPRTRPAL